MTSSTAAPSWSDLTRAQVRSLVEAPPAPSASIYLGTFRAGPDAQQNMIKLRNLFREASAKAQQLTTGNGEARSLAGELGRLQEGEGLAEFAREPRDGLALFVRPGGLRAFKTDAPLDDRVWVSSRFHVMPLLECLQGDGRYYVLAVSQKDVRMLQGDKRSLTRIDDAGLPKSLADALDIDEFVQSTQIHTAAQGGRKALAHGGSIFHGHGGGDQGEKKDLLLEYFHRLDDAIQAYLHDEAAPQGVAGVDYVLPIYQQGNHNEGVVDVQVGGNPEGWNEQQLHRAAWNVVKPRFDAARRAAIDQYGALAARNQGSDNVFRLIDAAETGRISTLLLQRGAHLPGIIDPQTGEASLADPEAPGSVDLLNHVAAQTLANRGAVYLMDQSEMPSDSPAAGLFRY
jgi:hypothetical protein